MPTANLIVVHLKCNCRSPGPVVLKILEDNDCPWLIHHALLTLAFMGEHKVIPYLKKYYFELHEYDRTNIVEAIGVLRVKNLATLVLDACYSTDFILRKTAINALGALGLWNSVVKACLIHMIGHNDWRIRLEAIRAVIKVGRHSKVLTHSLVCQLGLGSKQITRASVEALLKFGKRTWPSIEPLLNSRKRARKNAAIVLQWRLSNPSIST